MGRIKSFSRIPSSTLYASRLFPRLGVVCIPGSLPSQITMTLLRKLSRCAMRYDRRKWTSKRTRRTLQNRRSLQRSRQNRYLTKTKSSLQSKMTLPHKRRRCQLSLLWQSVLSQVCQVRGCVGRTKSQVLEQIVRNSMVIVCARRSSVTWARLILNTAQLFSMNFGR
eukprot:01867_1